MKVLLIIPAFNEEKNIEKVVDNLISNYPEFDYVVINDGSRDNTSQICKDRNYSFLDLPSNLGIGGCVQTGYQFSVINNYDITIQLDGDGQHDPVSIKTLIAPIIEGNADMVIGSRFITKEGFQTSALRRTGIAFLRIVIKICCGYNASDATSGFRASNRKLTKFFSEQYAHDYPEPEAIVASVLNGYKVLDVPVLMNERTSGKSSINGLKSVYYMIKVSLALFIFMISEKRWVGSRK